MCEDSMYQKAWSARLIGLLQLVALTIEILD
jgi:hypothetical protein